MSPLYPSWYFHTECNTYRTKAFVGFASCFGLEAHRVPIFPRSSQQYTVETGAQNAGRFVAPALPMGILLAYSMAYHTGTPQSFTKVHDGNRHVKL